MDEFIAVLLLVIVLLFLGGVVGHAVGFADERDAACVMLGYDEYVNETCRVQLEDGEFRAVSYEKAFELCVGLGQIEK